MSLNASLTRVLIEYSSSSKRGLKGSPLAAFIRDEIPKEVRKIVGDIDRYLVKGSPGQSNWAAVPWVAVFDRLVTLTAQQGYYLVYLFAEDGSSVYLSLNQGVTTIRKQYRRNAKNALKIRAQDFLIRLGKIDASLIRGPIDLRLRKNVGLGGFYEKGAICSLKYERDRIPSNAVLGSDLKLLLGYYVDLVSRESKLFDLSEQDGDEVGLKWEDLTKLRMHKRVERSRDIPREVKRKLGFTCQACGFNFGKVYGKLGKKYIEAHHLTPVAELRGQRVAVDPAKDFAVLCSNCHRMIHRSQYISDVESFRLLLQRRFS